MGLPQAAGFLLPLPLGEVPRCAHWGGEGLDANASLWIKGGAPKGRRDRKAKDLSIPHRLRRSPLYERGPLRLWAPISFMTRFLPQMPPLKGHCALYGWRCPQGGGVWPNRERTGGGQTPQSGPRPDSSLFRGAKGQAHPKHTQKTAADSRLRRFGFAVFTWRSRRPWFRAAGVP